MKQNVSQLLAVTFMMALLSSFFVGGAALGQTATRRTNNANQQTKKEVKTLSEKSEQFALTSIGQISVNVHDVKRAIAFYRDTLGMKFLFDTGHMAFFDCGGVRLMLAIPEKPEFDHPSSFIYYRVADIQRSYELLVARGVRFEEKPTFVAHLADHDLWMAFFRDVDNNPLVLMSEVPRS